MPSFNSSTIMGNLTRDPELKYLEKSGTACAEFTVAVNERFVKEGERKEKVNFLDVKVFGNQAENCGQYLRKGSGVLVSGKLDQQRWETDDGKKRSRIYIIAKQVQFLSGGKGQAGDEPPVDEGDIPF